MFVILTTIENIQVTLEMTTNWMSKVNQSSSSSIISAMELKVFPHHIKLTSGMVPDSRY